jgi:hypothetical protein
LRGLGKFCEFGGDRQNLGATDGGGSVFDPRPDIRCPEVGKTGSRVSRLMNGKDGEDAYRNGLEVAYRSGGVSLRRDKAAC